MLEILQTYGVFYLIGQYPNGPLGGLVLTLSLAALALVLALPVGLLLALCRISPFGILRWPATVLVYVVRGTPLLMVIFWAYFLLPSLMGHKTDQAGAAKTQVGFCHAKRAGRNPASAKLSEWSGMLFSLVGQHSALFYAQPETSQGLQLSLQCTHDFPRTHHRTLGHGPSVAA